MTQGAVRDTTGYVNYVYNISARGTTQVASQLMGLSNITGSILGQLAFQTSSYLSSTEGALLSMGIVATAGFAKATQKATEFDQALSTIGAISGKTRNEVSGLGDQAIAMSNKFGMAVGEMTTGLEALARAGVSTGNMNSILEQAMGLSKLEGLSLETAINDLISTTNLLDTEGLDLESPEYAEAVRRQNQRITATSEAAPINAQDIIHTLEHVGGYASSTNLDQEDLFAVIAQLGSKGTKSEMAGTSLRAFLAAGQKDTAQRALKRIGLDVSDLWKNDDTILSITDMKDVLDQAMDAKGYTKQERLEFYSDFAGYKQANQIMKIDTTSAREFKEKIDRSWDMSAKISQVIGTAETHIQGLMQAGNNLLVKVGEPFLPIISTIAATLKTGIDIINMIPGSNIVIAGGLILASVKAISTIFNKIAPQLVASKGHIGGISGLFRSIREDLHESFVYIKNINNSDFMKQQTRKIEANNINERDKYAYWESKGYNVNGISDVWRLEREHNFRNDDKYVKWKQKEAQKPLKREKEPRNQRKKSSNPPKGATSSSDNREQNKISDKISRTDIDDIIETIKKIVPELNKNISENLGNQKINPNNIIEEISKNATFKVSNNLKFDSNIFDSLKRNIFKVEIVNTSRIVPVHETGTTKWNEQKRADKEVTDFVRRGSVEVHKPLKHSDGSRIAGRGSYNKKLVELDYDYKDTDTRYHELGHSLFSKNGRKSNKIKITKNDRKILSEGNLDHQAYKTLGNIVNEYEADLYAIELAQLKGEKVSAKRLNRLNIAKKVLDKHNVFSDVREDYVKTMAHSTYLKSDSVQEKFDNAKNISHKTQKNLNQKKEKERKSNKEEAKNRVKSKMELQKEFKGSFDEEKINNVQLFTKINEPTRKNELPTFVLTDEDIKNFIDAIDIDFGFDTDTAEGKHAQQMLLNQFKQVIDANISAGHINIRGGSKESLMQQIDNELTKYIDFARTKATNLIMTESIQNGSQKIYSEKDLERKLEAPSQYSLAGSLHFHTEKGGSSVKNVARQDSYYKFSKKRERANAIIGMLNQGINPFQDETRNNKKKELEQKKIKIQDDIIKSVVESDLGFAQEFEEIDDNKITSSNRFELFESALHTYQGDKDKVLEEINNLNHQIEHLGKESVNDLTLDELKEINKSLFNVYGKKSNIRQYIRSNRQIGKLSDEDKRKAIIDNISTISQFKDDNLKSEFTQSVYNKLSGSQSDASRQNRDEKYTFNKRTGLDYSVFTKNHNGRDLIAIAIANGVEQKKITSALKTNNKWANLAKEIGYATRNEKSIDTEIASQLYTNKFANYFLNDLSTTQQKEVQEKLGLQGETPLHAIINFLRGERRGSYSDDELEYVKMLGNIIEGEPDKLHIGGTQSSYSNTVKSGQNVISTPHKATEHALLLQGEDGIGGINLHAKKVTDILLELAIQNAIEAIKKEIYNRTGEKITTQQAIALVPNLHIPHSERWHPHQLSNFNDDDLEQTKRRAAQTMHDNAKGNIPAFSTYGANQKTLGKAVLVRHPDDDSEIFPKENKEIKGRSFREIMANARFEENRGASKQRRSAKITGIKAKFEGQDIDMFSREEATHGRNFQNAAYLDANGNLLGFIANDYGDIREGYNWALERRRNRIYTQQRQIENFGTLAHKYDLSRSDVMSQKLTPDQEKRIQDIYKSQAFVNIDQYIEEYGEDAFTQIRGQMALSNLYRHTDKGIELQGNVFHTEVTPEEYQRRLAAGLIYTKEGEQGILNKRVDKKTGQELYKINDYEMLHYSLEDITAKVLTEDIAWQKEMETTFKGLNKRDMLHPDKLAEEILRKPDNEIKKIMNAIFLYDQELGNALIEYADKQMDEAIQAGNLVGITVLDYMPEEEILPPDFNKKKRSYLNKQDRDYLIEKYNLNIDDAKNAKEASWMIRNQLDEQGKWDEAATDLYNKSIGRKTAMREIIPTPEEERTGKTYTAKEIMAWVDNTFGQGASDLISAADMQYIFDDANPFQAMSKHIKDMAEIQQIRGAKVNPDWLGLGNRGGWASDSEESLSEDFNDMIAHLETESLDYFLVDQEQDVPGLPLEYKLDPGHKDLRINEGGYEQYGEAYRDSTGKLPQEIIDAQKVFNKKTGKWEDITPESKRALKLNTLLNATEKEKVNNLNQVKTDLKTLNETKQQQNELAKQQKEEFLNMVRPIHAKVTAEEEANNQQKTLLNIAKNINDENKKEKNIDTLIKENLNIAKNIQEENENIEQETTSPFTSTSHYEQSLPTYDDILKGQYANKYEKKINDIKSNISAKVTSGVNTMYNTVGGHDNSNIVQPLSKASKTLDDATLKLQGFTEFLQSASDKFAPLITAVMALEGVIYTLQSVSKVTSGLEEILNLKKIANTTFKGETFDLFGQTFEKNSNSAKILLSISSVLGTVIETITSFISAFMGPLLLLAGAFAATKIALDWSYKSHEKYLKELQDEEKTNKSRAKALATTTEQSKKAYEQNKDEQKEAILGRKYRLNQQKLDAANISRQSTALKLAGAENDTLWGKYGITSALDKMQGKYESTAAEYDGTSGQIRRIKEHTTGGQGLIRGMPGYYSEAEGMASAYYDANQLAISVMDEYKDELGELYDTETNAMRKNPENPRETKMFQDALDKFVEATGITREHAQQYLDYMQTEHNVDNATQAMQAQADTISANTEMKIQAIAFGGNPADVLGLNGIESQQNAMVQAQADMIKLELSSQLWWKAVWSTITSPVRALISPVFAITHILSAIWSFITGNWDAAGMHMKQAGASLNVFGETATYWGAWATAESTDLNAIGQGAVDESDRANYGNKVTTSGSRRSHVKNPESNAIFGFRPIWWPNNPDDVHNKNHTKAVAQTAQESFFSTLIGGITSLLGTIVNILTVGALGLGVKSIFDHSSQIQGWVEKITDYFPGIKSKIDKIPGFNNIGEQSGNIIDFVKSIKDKFSFNLGGISEEAEWYRNGGLDNASLPAKAYGKLLNYIEGNPDSLISKGHNAIINQVSSSDSALSKWTSYPREKFDQLKDFGYQQLIPLNTVQRKKDFVENVSLNDNTITDDMVDALIEKYNIDTSKVSTSFGRRTVASAFLQKNGKWDEAMGDLYDNEASVRGTYDDKTLAHMKENGLIGSAKTAISENYAKPWSKYINNKIDTKKQDLKESFWAMQEKAEWYRNGIDLDEENGGASSFVQAYAKGLDIKDQIFGKNSQTDFKKMLKDPKEFLSDPRNIESMGRDIYSNNKDKFLASDYYKDLMANANAYRERPDIMENAPISAKLMGKGLDWKEKYLQGDSIQDVLKDPERTVGIIQGTIEDIQGGALDDLNIGDTVKEKVSGFFDKIKEGAEEGIDDSDDDGKGGAGGLIQKAKDYWNNLLTDAYAYNERPDLFEDASDSTKLLAKGLKFKDKILGTKENTAEKLSGVKSRGQSIGEKIKNTLSSKVCPRCGFKNDNDAEFCAECGQKLDEEPKPLKDTLTTEGVKDKMNMLKNQGRLTPWFGEDDGALGSTNTKGVISLFPDVLRQQEGGLGANITQTTFHEVAHNLLGHNDEDRTKTIFEDKDDDWENKVTELEAEMASVGAMQDLGLEVPEWNLERLDRMKKQAQKKTPHGGVNLDLVNAARKEMVENADFILGSINNVMSFQTAMDNPWTLDEISDVQSFVGKKMSGRLSPNDDDSIMPTLFEKGRIYQKDNVTFGGHLMNKAPIQSTMPMSTDGIVSEESSVLDLIDTDLFDKIGGKGGKVGKVLKGIGGKAKGGIGKLAKGGTGKLAKSGIGKLAKGGIGKAVSGLGKKAIGGIGKKLATKGIAQIGSKVLGGALMATGIGAPLGLLLESPLGGMLIEGAMDLGGKALGAVGGAVGGIGKALFGRKHVAGSGGGLLSGLMAASPLGMMASAFGGGGPRNLGMVAAPLGGMVGILGQIFTNNKETKNLNQKIEAHAGKTLEAVREQNAKTTPNSNSSGGNITIQNININTQDDPEAIKAMFLELIVELQEQVSPRLVSRTTGKASNGSNSTQDSSTDTSSTEQTDTPNTDANGNITSNRGH